MNQENSFEEVGGQSNNKQWKPQDAVNFANPKYPKEIIGYFKSTSERNGPNGPFNIAVITRVDPATKELEDFDVSGGSVLDGKLADIPLGSFIKIVFEGKAQSKTPGRSYNIWKTFVDKNAVPFDKVGGIVKAQAVVTPAATKSNTVNNAASNAAASGVFPGSNSDAFKDEDLPF